MRVQQGISGGVMQDSLWPDLNPRATKQTPRNEKIAIVLLEDKPRPSQGEPYHQSSRRAAVDLTSSMRYLGRHYKPARLPQDFVAPVLSVCGAMMPCDF